MRVLLVYDEWAGEPVSGPVDAGAEYEDRRTIDALLETIEACGHEAVGLVFGENFVQRVRELGPDLVFNIAEGVRGPVRESLVPGWLDHLGVPYTGSDGLTMAVSLDKALTKTLAAARAVRTPAFRRIKHEGEIAGIDLGFPLFVKPNGEGSSMGVRRASKVDTAEALGRQVRWVLQTYGQDCLVEEFAPGRELCVGLIGNAALEVLPIVEIRCEGGFYAWEDKHAHRKELICPAAVSEELGEAMREMAVTMYRALGCRDFARVDFRVDREDGVTFLEINPLPGLSPYYSVFTAQAQAAGMSHVALISRIIDLAIERGRPQRARRELRVQRR